MKLSQQERIALGIARNDGNHVPMTAKEYKNIRKTLKLSQEGMGILLGCTRFWISKCEKDESLISYAHAFILRLLMDAPQATRLGASRCTIRQHACVHREAPPHAVYAPSNVGCILMHHHTIFTRQASRS